MPVYFIVPKQQFAERHVASLGHIILIWSQPVCFLFSLGTDHLTCRGGGGGGEGYGFLFSSEFFFRTTRELGYMTKTLNQIFFSLHRDQNIFSATLEVK